jgi:signal transduction histidine kinase
VTFLKTNLTYTLLEPDLRKSQTAAAGASAPNQLTNDKFLQRVVDACAANVVALDETGAVLQVSRAWRTLAARNGFPSQKESYGLEALQTCNDRVKSRFLHHVQDIIKGLHAEIQNEYILQGAHSAKWFLVRAAKLVMPGVSGCRILVTLEDITRRKLAEEELRHLGGRLIKAQEEERSRVGRDLHDDLSQRVAVFSIELEQLRRKIPGERDDLTGSIMSLITRVQDLASDIHRLSYELHPFKLDTLGLSAAIKALCEEISNHRDLEIKFQQKGFPAALSPDITLCIYRIAQEALHNIVKHSGAREAKLTLTKTSEAVRFRVVDRGTGFDIDAAKMKKRLGLLSMKERLRLVGGELSIRSRPAEGTQIDVMIPLSV